MKNAFNGAFKLDTTEFKDAHRRSQKQSAVVDKTGDKARIRIRENKHVAIPRQKRKLND